MSNIRVPVMPEPDRYKAAINCEHAISTEVIKLFFDPSEPGHNALNQLGNRLAAIESQQLAARDAQWLEMVGPVVEALERIAGYSMSQFKNPADMAAQCVDDAAKALSAITKD